MEWVRNTLDLMAALAIEKDAGVSELAWEIVGTACESGGNACKGGQHRSARAIHDLVKKYDKGLDPLSLETVQPPATTLARGRGDAEDRAILAAAMALATNHSCAFRAVAADQARPDLFSTVYTVIRCRGCGAEVTPWPDPPGNRLDRPIDPSP